MVAIKPSEMRLIDDIFDMNGGYVLNFSNATFAQFFDAELGIDIYQEKYALNGSSKARHVRAFIQTEGPYLVGQLLRKLWEYREDNPIPIRSAPRPKKPATRSACSR